MKTTHFFITLALMAVLLAACTPATPFPTPKPSNPEGPMPTSEPLPDDQLVLSWQREGGIAGFCDSVEILANGAYTVKNCQYNVVNTGQLSDDQYKQLLDWVNTFASFKEGTDPNTPPFPDQMFIEISFTGQGSVEANPDDVAAISNLAATLAAPRPDMGIDPVQPKAAFMARDFLAAQLNIPSEQIKIVSAEAVEWSDSCLGLGKPEEICAQVITPGYKVMLEAEGKSYEAHTDQNGDVVRLKP